MPVGEKKEDTVKKNLKKTTKVNTNVKIGTRKIEKTVPDKAYKCWRCGKSWDVQKSHFPASSSPNFYYNNSYINVCRDCLENEYKELVDLFSGSEEKAIEFLCQKYDWYFSEKALAASRKISDDRSRMLTYLQKKNLEKGKSEYVEGITYIDTIRERALMGQNTITQTTNRLAETGNEGNVSQASKARWGEGIFTDQEYRDLDAHYKMLKTANPNCDSNQEIFIKDLCYSKIMQMRAVKNNDEDKFMKLTKSYAETFKSAGLKTITENEVNDDDCWGKWVSMVGKYTPEEYYKDDTTYKDFDGIGKIFERFILRPLKNLMTGTTDRDPEYSVKDGDSDDK